jgi:hypothetical protein
MPKRTPLWRCAKCGHRFASRNLWHSCGNVRLAHHFKGRSPVVGRVFARWRALARACGPVTVYAQKTRIVFQARVRFAGAIVHDDWLEATLWLGRAVAHPCLHRVESFGRAGYGIRFRLTSPDDIDSRLEGFMREAYAEHVAAPGPIMTKPAAARHGSPRERRPPPVRRRTRCSAQPRSS